MGVCFVAGNGGRDLDAPDEVAGEKLGGYVGDECVGALKDGGRDGFCGGNPRPQVGDVTPSTHAPEPQLTLERLDARFVGTGVAEEGRDRTGGARSIPCCAGPRATMAPLIRVLCRSGGCGERLWDLHWGVCAVCFFRTPKRTEGSRHTTCRISRAGEPPYVVVMIPSGGGRGRSLPAPARSRERNDLNGRRLT